MSIDWSPFAQLIQESDQLVLTSHARPDCDALGSELGMAMILESLGKRVRIVNPDAIPKHLTFIDPEGRIEVIGEGISAADLKDADTLMVLDTSAWIQLGAMGDAIRELSAGRIVVDHHVSGDDLEATEFKDTKAPATGVLVVEACDALGAKLTPKIAQVLLAAISTDTGWFRFSSVSGDTFRTVGRLVDAGASPPDLYAELYEHESLARIHLRGEILAKSQAELDERLVYSQVTRADFEGTGAEQGDTEDVINFLNRLRGSEVALLFTERPDCVKVSIRSRGKVDARELAEQFGGGGHIAAAGATVEGSLEGVKGRVLDAVRAAMK